MRAQSLLSLLSVLACGPQVEKKPPSDVRTVHLTLVPEDPLAPDGSLGGRAALQLVAVRIENGALVTNDVHVGSAQDVFTGSESEEGALGHDLWVTLPVEHAYSLFIQTPRGDPSVLGVLAMTLEWDDGVQGVTNRLRPGRGNVDLGSLLWVSRELWGTPYARLVVPWDHNPMALSDVDRDGINDLVDGDDDNDGILDNVDDDGDGNGQPDATEILSGLRDANGIRDGDGVPDILE